MWMARTVFDAQPACFRSALAHEIGRFVLHASLYLDEEFPRIVARCRGGGGDLQRGFQCGEDQIQDRPQSPITTAHPLFHLEYQANLYMVATLTPATLVRMRLKPWTRETVRRDGSRLACLEESARREAVEAVAGTFEVSRELAGYRVDELFPPVSANPPLSMKPNIRRAQSAPGIPGVVSGKTQQTLW